MDIGSWLTKGTSKLPCLLQVLAVQVLDRLYRTRRVSERVGEIRSNALRTTFTGFRGNIVMGNDRVMISISPEKSLRSNCMAPTIV